jgi:hypothetical protein
MIKVVINNHLRVRKIDLPPGHEAAIKERLTIPNGARIAAIKRKQWSAHEMPETIALYEEDGPWLVMLRGFAAELHAGLKMAGHELQWDDQTSAPSLPLLELINQGPTLREDQERACRAILSHRQGVLQAPTAAGKTVVVLEAWRRSGVPGMILVEKAGLAKQWRERAREHLGIETGMIGEGEWDEKPLTIAMMQTLHRREVKESGGGGGDSRPPTSATTSSQRPTRPSSPTSARAGSSASRPRRSRASGPSRCSRVRSGRSSTSPRPTSCARQGLRSRR